MNTKAIVEFIHEYVTKENITFLLGLFGSAGTFYTFVSKFFLNHVKVECSIAEYVPAKDSVILYMMFINKSHLSVSITDVKIWNRSSAYSCEKAPHIVRIDARNSINKAEKTVIYKEAIYAAQFPINLPSLSGSSGYLYFQIPQENFQCDSKSLTVELNTNRNQKYQMTLLLPES